MLKIFKLKDKVLYKNQHCGFIASERFRIGSGWGYVVQFDAYFATSPKDSGHWSLLPVVEGDLTARDITSFNAGDVFNGSCKVLQDAAGEFVLAGLGGDFNILFSDRPRTKQEMLDYLNRMGYKKTS